MATPLPEINSIVHMAIPGLDTMCLAKVHDAEDDRIVLTRPVEQGEDGYARPIETPAVGSVVVIVWTSERGRFEMPVRLVSAQGGEVALWRTEVAGEAEVSQRRDFARVAVALPMTLTFLERRLIAATEGTTVDLSEGGLRCRVRGGADAQPGEAIEVVLQLEDEPLTAQGEVIRVVRVTDLGTELALRIDLPEIHARRVRKLVLERQRLARQARQ